MSTHDHKTSNPPRSGFVAPVPRTWKGCLLAIGPGVVMALTWLGQGDLIDATVSGTNYGYAFMWVFVIALISRWFFTSAIAKAYLAAANDDKSLFTGFRRLWRWLPLLVGIAAFLGGFGSQIAATVAVGTALYHLSGGLGGATWGIFLWCLLAAAATVLVMARGNYLKRLEIIARVAVVTLLAIFVGSAVSVGPDWAHLGQGLLFDVPADEGVYGSLLVLSAVIGTAGVSATNLIYPEFLRDRGWRTPQHLPLQRIDLLVGVLALIVVDLSVWVVGAEIARPAGISVEGIDGLASTMELVAGAFGRIILWVGLFFAAYTTYIGQAAGFTSILLSGVRESLGKGALDAAEDRLFRPIQLGLMLIVPALFALPMFPGVVHLTLLSGGLLAGLAPVLLAAVLWATNSRKVMLPQYINRWWENVILTAIGGVGLVAAYGTATSFLGV